MERNANDNFGGSNLGQSASAGAGASGGSFGASAGGYDQQGGGSATSGVGDQGRVQQAKEAVADRLGTVREKASNLSSSLADRLEAGADRLRQRTQGGAYAGDVGGVGDGSSLAADDRMSKVNDTLARGMQASADFLREGDLRGSVENQVRTNPGRTLLVALGVGYLLGKAFRGNSR